MEKIKRIDKNFKTMPIKGKQYVEVKERIKYLAFDFDGNYSIKTKFWHYPESRTWVVKATLTMEQNGATSTYTGLAQEVESDSYKDVNHTSALENCETSAIGRACAMAGIGVDISIASADEMNKALNRQTQNKPAQATQEKKLTQGKGEQEKTQEKPEKLLTKEQHDTILELLKNPAQSEATVKRVTDKLYQFTYQEAIKTIVYLKKVIAEASVGKELSNAS